MTPKTLADFRGMTLVLPDVRVLGESEKTWLQAYAAQGKTLVITGSDTTGIAGSSHVIRFPACPGRAYNAALERDFDRASPDSQQAFLDSLQGGNTVKIKAGPTVATSIARTSDGHITCFFANFGGLRGGSNPVQTPLTGVEVTVTAKADGKGFFLPFLGEAQTVQGFRHGDSITYALPPITKGAVFWIER